MTFNSALQQPEGDEGLNPRRQSDWRKIVEESNQRPCDIIAQQNWKEGTFYSWLRCENTPRNKEKVVEVMTKLGQTKKLPYHPSYGYATPEQIEELQKLGMGPDRDYLLAKIAKQNKNNSKI